MTINLVKGDITDLPFKVDYIVCSCNPANKSAGGVCGAIHQAAKISILGLGTHTTKFVVSEAGGLSNKCRLILHAVAPVYDPNEEPLCRTLLRHTYNNLFSSVLTGHHIAVPSLGTGIYDWPLAQAAAIFVGRARQFHKIDITMVAFDDETFKVYDSVIKSDNIYY